MQLNKDILFVLWNFQHNLTFPHHSHRSYLMSDHFTSVFLNISGNLNHLRVLGFCFVFFFNPKASNLLLHLISSFWQLWVSSCNPARWHLYKVLIEQCLFRSCLRGMAQTFSLHCSLTSLVSRQHLKSNKPLKNTWTHQNIVRSAWRRILGSS